MFANKPRTEIVFHVLLAAVILFNTALPAKALASPSSALPSTNNNNQYYVGNNAVSSQSQQMADVMANFDQLPIAFMPNVGQEEDDGVRFQTQALGGELFFTSEEVVFSLLNPVEVSAQNPEKGKKIRYDLRPASVLRIQYMDANSQPEVTGTQELPGVVNYLKGMDPSKWFTNLPTYSGVAYHELYSGIELRYEGTDGILKSSFHVAPGADPSAIVWKYKGAENVRVDESGNLVITMPPPADGEQGIVLTEYAPIAWQEVDGNRVMVAVQYVMDKKDKKVGFLFPDGYESTLPLVIDPELTASTYLGGSKSDEGDAIAVDADGNIFLTGKTSSTNFPTVNPFQTNKPSDDVFVTKLDPLARTILYSTYVGGNGNDHAWDIALDSGGRITLVGETESSDFPIQNAFDTSYAGGTCEGGDPCDDVFVLQLEVNSTTTTKRYGTYLGGSWDEEAFSLAIDPEDKINLTGFTRSSTFPTFHAYQSIFGGGTCDGFPCEDVFVAKIDPALSGNNSLLYSTFLGGSNYEKGKGIAVDANGLVYVTGYTRSDGLATPNAYQLTRTGDSDVFVAKFNTTLSETPSLLYSTYLGGDYGDHAHGIALNGADQVYLTGYTESPGFPRQNAFDNLLDGVCGPDPDDFCLEAFVTHLDISTNTLVYSSYLGGSGEDDATSIAVDNVGNAYVTGYTESTNFPKENEIQSLKGGDLCSVPPCSDAFVTKVNASGSAMIYSTYLGGDAEDYSNAITVDALGGAYITGYTYSGNFPVTNGSGIASTTYKDAFVAKIFDPAPPPPTATNTPAPTKTPTSTPTPTATKAPPAGVSCIDWRDGDPPHHGWIQSPWMSTDAQVQWDGNGMYGSATNSDTYEVGAYLQVPAGGTYKVLFYGQHLNPITVAQGASAPTSDVPLSETLFASADGSYPVTKPYIEVQWSITAPIDLAATPLFQTFCYSPFTPTVTPTFTPTPTPSNQPPTTTSDLIVQSVSATSIVFDGQTLQATGSVSADIKNNGSEPANGYFTIVFYEDLNGNKTYEAVSDNLLGSAVQNGLASAAATTVSAQVSGTLLFQSNLIYAFADAENSIVEVNENNNINHSAGTCTYVPSTSPFSPILEWQWTGGTTLPTYKQVMMAPAVADLNQDAIPEIIFTSFAGFGYEINGHLRAINGRDGSEIFTVTDSAYDVWGVGSIAVGDIDLDGRYEIVAVDESANRLITFEHDGTFKWRSPSILGGINRGGPAIADLDGDGTPEIIVGSTVLNNNGVIQWVGAYGRGNNHNGPLSLVADLDLDGHPEVVAGNTAYRADGTVYWNKTSVTDGFNAVADFNADGFPEVVLVDAGKVYLLDHNGVTIWGAVFLPGGGDGGAPTIADVDNDGQPEIGVAGASQYTVFETNGAIKWNSLTQDSSSHSTGSSVFDFEADGSAEIIYRDEVKLRVYRGSDGIVLWDTDSTSGTTYKLPVIADVDADGNAEIVMVSNNYFNPNIGTFGLQVYGDSADQWVATRQLWNQHTYHITNTNDDGSIPAQETNNWEVYNNYRQNVLTSGCLYAQPDITASYVRKQVNETTITITTRLGNGGGAVAGSNVPVAFYNGDPNSGGSLLGTAHTNLYLEPGEFEDVILTVPVGTVALPLWVVADDNGNGQGILTESNESNNFYNSHVYLTLTTNQPPVTDAGPDQQLPLSGATITASLTGTASDDGLPAGILTHVWALVNGSGDAVFADPTALQTTVTFDQAGVYVLRLTASDDDLTSSDELTITITSTITPTPTALPTNTPPVQAPLVIPGWIGSPAQASTVSGIVPITLASGITLQDGTLDYWPVGDLNDIHTLVEGLGGKTGGDTLWDLDTTTMANGSYIIRLQGTNSAGLQQDSGIMITVTGEYKPGRVRFTITDLTIPVAGMPIVIGRTYDSLERGESSDFGHGWSLAIGNPKLETDLAKNVTLTMPDGKRSTFYFTPIPYPNPFGFLMYPHYTPEAGVYGSLEAPDCLVVVSGGQYFCFLGGEYSPAEYTYTDPYGRKFLMDADGTLRTITDLNHNVLTFSPDGITSSAGNINVPFVRDPQGRITKITYPAGKEYIYEYEDEITGVDLGDLRTVIFPTVTVPTEQAIILRYTYDNHFFKEAFDPRNYRPVLTTYDSAGRMESVTDAANNVTTYSYDLDLRKTTIHYLGEFANQNDNLGDAILIYDEAGYLTSYIDTLNHETVYGYNANHNLTSITDMADPLLPRTTRYTYNTDGHPTSIIDPLNKTLGTVEYNQYGGPTALTTLQGGDATVQYDPITFMPESASDALGSLGGYTWTPQGNPETFTDQYGETTSYTYTPQGYLDTVTDPLGHKTHYVYDEFGRVTDTTTAYQSADASTTHYVYDELGRMIESTIAFGTNKAATTKYEYDANGNRTAIEDPLNRRTEYNYDAANRLVDVIHARNTPLESTTHYEYDVYSRLTDVIVALGKPEESTTHYTYYNNGLKKDVTIAFGETYASTTHYEYYDDGRVKDVTIAHLTADAATTHYEYDAAGRMTDVTIAVGMPETSTTHYEYYDSGLTKSVTSAFGTNFKATTTYFYDARGRSTLTQYPDGTTTTQAYDPLPFADGWMDTTTDQAGVETQYVYDAAGRLNELIASAIDPVSGQPIEHTTDYVYDAANRLTDTFDPLNHRTSFTYYPTGQMETSTAWFDANTPYTTTYNYNNAGEQVSVTDANGHETTYDYNERGFLEKTIYPPTAGVGEIATSQTYDFAGRLLTSTDENSITTRNAYNAAGQLIGVTLADGTADATTIQYGYNLAGQLTDITDAKLNVTRFEYNDAGQQTKKIWADTTTFEQFGYNAAGNMVSHRLGDGKTNTFRYDSMNRLTDLVYFDGRSIVFEYTNDGQREKASLYPAPLSVPQVYSYAYDPFERLKSVTSPDGRAVSYTYNDNDQRATMTTPVGTTTYGYNGLSQLASVSAVIGGSTQETTYQYDSVGFLIDEFLPNDVHTEYTPNERNQLTKVVSKNSSGVTLLDIAYDELDKAGNRKHATEAGGISLTWEYDNLYRLTDETRNGTNTHLEYDAAGNRESMTVGSATTNYTYNALDQLTSAGTVTFDYDARGNMWHRTSGSDVTTYTYNAADQLTNVTATGVNATYVYNADGKRVKQTLGSTVTNYLWDEASPYGDVVLETDGNNNTLARYVLGGTQLISQTRGATTNYFLQDGQNSTRALTNSSGTVTDTYSYTAFGESYTSSGTTVNPYRYTGQQFDSLTGLYSLRARYYNPALGRFLSQDTYPYNFSNPVELNRYVYAANSPINLTDPTGNAALPEYSLLLGEVIGGAIGAVQTYACGGNLAENVAWGVFYGFYFTAGLWLRPLATNAVGLALSGVGAVSAFHDKQVNGWNACNLFTAGISLLGVAFSAGGLAKGGIDYINNNVLRGLGEFGYYDEMLNSSMAHDGYYSGTGPITIGPEMIGATGGPYKTIPNQLGDLDMVSRTVYLDLAERGKYEIFVQNGKLVYRDGRVVAYGEIKRSVAVMDEKGHIYFSSGGMGKLRHSTFTAGGDLAYAGTWEISYGVLKVITSHSGHYVPEWPVMNNQLLQELGARGLDISHIISIFKKYDPIK